MRVSPRARPKRAEPKKAAKPLVERSQGGLQAIVKALRTRAGLTLTQLAKRSDLAASTISKIETGQLSPGYETIQRLAVGLDVEVAQLFQPRIEPVTTGRRGVTRNGSGVLHRSKHYEYEALAADVSRKEFLPLVATVKARSIERFGSLPSHEGEEFVYVISGSVTLYSEHYEPLALGPGDSVYFESRAGHALVSTGPRDAKIVWICSDRNALEGARKISDA
jgi:transcriptional regulator with XRE-family HTH domain